MTVIASPTSTSTAGDMILSIRDKIPDVVSDPNIDGTAFSLAQILRWMNDAMITICAIAPVIRDWWALPSVTGMDVYVLPNHIVNADQVFYNMMPMSKNAEMDTIFTSKVSGRSWWMGEHSQHAIPRLQLWPACDTTGGTTTLSGNVASTDITLPINTATSFSTSYGFIQVGTELILFRNLPSGAGNITNILRGQGGTVASAHNTNDTVTECNIWMKASRLPTKLTGPSDLVEIPRGLWPLVQLGVISSVREAEQDAQLALTLRKEFLESCEKLAAKAAFAGIQRHGLQVRDAPPGPELFMGRTYIP